MASRQQEIQIIEESFLLAEKTCTAPWVLDFDTPLPHTSLHLHQVFEIVGGIAGIINITIAAYLLQRHYFNWTLPREQKQHARIIWFLIVQSLIEWFSIYSYKVSGYIQPIGDYYEGFAILALFILYIHFISPGEGSRDDSVRDASQRIMVEHIPPAQSQRTRRIWLYVFQLAVTRIATLVANDVLYDTTCPLSPVRGRGYIAIEVVQGLSTGFAVYGVIVFERRMKAQLTGHRALLKLVSFKAIVGLVAVQEIIFSVLAENRIFFPTAPYHIGYNDFAKGLPALIQLWELTVVSVLFLWSFNAKAYRDRVRDRSPLAAGPVTALLQTFNPTDIWQGFAFAVRGPSLKSSVAARKQQRHVGKPEMHSGEYQDRNAPLKFGAGTLDV